MAKLFEKVDDNPGSYFGMLAEGWEDMAYDDEVPGYEPKKKTWADEKYDELMNKGKDNWNQDDWDSYNYIMQVWGESGVFDESFKESANTSYIVGLLKKYAKDSEAGQPYQEFMFKNTYAIPIKDSTKYVGKVRDALSSDGFKLVDSSDGEYYAYTKITNSGDRVLAGIFYNEGDRGDEQLVLQIAVNPEDEELSMYFEESLKEDKFVSRDKMSKKDRKELDSKKRNTWGNTNPVTRVQPNKKAYDRKRDKKELDEALDIGYWSEDSWGSDYPPDNWEEIVSRANEMIKNKYLQTHDEEETRDYSARLWDGYCRRAEQLTRKNKNTISESLTEDSEVFKDMSNALDDIEYLCKDTYNWETSDWNNKENIKRTAERIIESAQVLLDSIKKY